MRTWKALAKGVFLETLRRKDMWVVAILGFLIMISAGALGFFGLQGLEIFAKDLAVSVLGAFSTMLAILVSSRMVPEEIKNRTLYPLLSRPISRLDFLIGKLLGAVLVSWTAFLILTILTATALAVFRVPFELILAQYVFLKMLGLVLVCIVSIYLSLVMTSSAATTISFILAFGSPLIIRGMVMGFSTSSEPVQWLFRSLNALLPQYGLFDIGSRAANIGWSPVPLWVVASLIGYLAAYSGALLSLSWLKFRKQAV